MAVVKIDWKGPGALKSAPSVCWEMTPIGSPNIYRFLVWNCLGRVNYRLYTWPLSKPPEAWIAASKVDGDAAIQDAILLGVGQEEIDAATQSLQARVL